MAYEFFKLFGELCLQTGVRFSGYPLDYFQRFGNSLPSFFDDAFVTHVTLNKAACFGAWKIRNGAQFHFLILIASERSPILSHKSSFMTSVLKKNLVSSTAGGVSPLYACSQSYDE